MSELDKTDHSVNVPQECAMQEYCYPAVLVLECAQRMSIPFDQIELKIESSPGFMTKVQRVRGNLRWCRLQNDSGCVFNRLNLQTGSYNKVEGKLNETNN